MRKHPKIGERCVCERCGQELEWNGKVWWDRGSDTTCGPYFDRAADEMVVEKHTRPHVPNAAP